MQIKNLKHFIASLYGVKQLSIIHINSPHKNTLDYDPVSLASVEKMVKDFLSIVDEPDKWTKFCIIARGERPVGYTIYYNGEVSTHDMKIFRVEEYHFAFPIKEFERVENLSNDAQAWLRPGGV